MTSTQGEPRPAAPVAPGDAPQDQSATAANPKRRGGGLLRYMLIRFLLIFPTIFILVTVVFFLMRATGDPITAAMGGRLTPQQLQERVHAAGYDRPLLVQYGEYLAAVLRGDFGITFTDNRPVTAVLAQYGSAPPNSYCSPSSWRWALASRSA